MQITSWNSGTESVSASGKEWILNSRSSRKFTDNFNLVFQATVEEPLHSEIGLIACLTANQDQEINCEILPEPLLNVNISCFSTSSALSSSSVVIENRWGQSTKFYKIKVAAALETPLRGDWWLSLQFSKPVSAVSPPVSMTGYNQRRSKSFKEIKNSSLQQTAITFVESTEL